jgi:hypothetical protein
MLLLLATLVVGAGTGFSAESQIPGAANVLTGYRLTAQLQASLFIGWSDRSGDPDAPCSSWAIRTGTSRVDAHTGPIPGFIQLYKPGTTHIVIRGRKIPVTWAELTAVGKGGGTAKRTYSHRSGVNWSAGCGGSRPQPERVPTPDCEPRTFTTKTASVIATERSFDGTLEVGNANPQTGADLVGLRKRSLDFTIVPGRELFRNCPGNEVSAVVGYYVRRYISDVGARLSDAEWSKLRSLRPGRRVQIPDHYGGRCDKHVSPRDCSFRLELDVWIRRVG